MTKFNKELAAEYLAHRKLTSFPLKYEYLYDGKGGLRMTIDQLHERMVTVAEEFKAMIKEMIDEE